MQDKRRFFSGATVEQAVARAARHYGVDPKELAYREREKKHGFLHRRRGIVVEVNPAELTRPSEPEATPHAPTSKDPTSKDQASNDPAPNDPTPSGASSELTGSWNEPVVVEEAPASAEPSPEGAVGGELFSEEWWHGESAGAAATGDGETAAAASGPGAQTSSPAAEAPRSDSRDAERPRPASPRPTTGADRTDLEASSEVAQRSLDKLLSLAGVSLESAIRPGEDRLEIDLSGNDQGVLLERSGEVLLAIEHLMPRVIRGLSGVGVPCRVDSDGFHATREADLRQLAERRAEEVRGSRRRRTLPPMSPEERRFIHMALADDRRVRTESRGEGYFKRVTIFPVGR